jgi:uncharacterized membrane protein
MTKKPKQSKNVFDKKEFVLIGFLLLFFIIGVSMFPSLPDKVPVHWNAAGEVDGYGSKYMASFLIPVIMLGIYFLFLLIPKMAVYKENIEKFGNFFFAFKVVMFIFMLVIYISSLVQINNPFNMNMIMIPLLSFLFAFIAVFLKHTKRNFFIGIRTPWTLSSDYVWKKTHELGAKLFGAYSLVILSLLLLPPFFFMWVFITPLIILIITLFLYSFVLFRKEQDSTKSKKSKKTTKNRKR